MEERRNSTCTTTHTLVNYATLDMSIKSQISTSYLLGLEEGGISNG